MMRLIPALLMLMLHLSAHSQEPQEGLDQARAQWARTLQKAIQRHWRPPTIEIADAACYIRITQSTAGVVLGAALVRSCGSSAADAAILDAVWKSSPLPLPDNPAVFEAEVIVSFSRS